jgi:hypothetical protein
MLSGCAFGPLSSQVYFCSSNDVCASGYVCVDGTCLAESQTVDPPDVPDAGTGVDSGLVIFDAGSSEDSGASAGFDSGIAPPDAGSLDSLAFVGEISNTFIQAGSCIPVTLEQRSAGAAAIASRNTEIVLDSQPRDALRFFSDSDCTNATAQILIPAGSSQQSVFVKAISGGTSSLTGTTSFAQINQMIRVQGLVRTSLCLMAADELTVDCPIVPAQLDISRTVLLRPL